ncbi:3-isopropylmalate dehydratase [Fodinibius halophilus]|uniref:3-isopropylmalate dehydratase n=1 Tax=Fodinibius halophilus TaxID=1736908 RepID=A0A6M1T7V0_9BACT|nr:3-isopropylmalate dehydratase [Fodinibius halophilus]NGP87204.1 3-isopropylmalate dehydratase [Fodinibius halophilus]
MSKQKITGKAFVLGRNIDTDQIIPAEHLVYSLDDPEERKFYGRHALSGVPDEQSGLPEGGIPLVEEDAFESEFSIIVGGPNFGCGSSREHAPASLDIAGVEAIIAPTFARIFYRNSVDGGFVIPYESLENLSKEVETGDELEIDPEKQTVTNTTQNKSYKIRPLGSVADIVNAGGIFEFARKEGMIDVKN